MANISIEIEKIKLQNSKTNKNDEKYLLTFFKYNKNWTMSICCCKLDLTKPFNEINKIIDSQL